MSSLPRRTILGCIALGLLIGASPGLAAWPANGRGVCVEAGDQRWPLVASDGHGGAIIAWIDFRGVPLYVYAQRITDDGNAAPGWPVGGAAVATSSYQSHLLAGILGDSEGGAFILWEAEAGPEAYTKEIRLQRITATGTRALGWPEGGVVVSGGPVSYDSRIASDGNGGAYIVWTDGRDFGANERDVYAQRVNADGTIPAPWPANGLPVVRAAGWQTNQRLSADGSGGLIVAWVDYRRELYGDIYAQRLTRLGSVADGWPADGVQACAIEYAQIAPDVVSDGTGGAIVVWEDYRSINPDIYASRITAAGSRAPGWQPNGEPLCLTGGIQSLPQAIPDGAGGAIVAWHDHNGPRGAWVSAIRVGSTGRRADGWPENGVQVGAASFGSRAQLALTPDGAGGAFYTWTDDRDYFKSGSDVFAQHLGADGTPRFGWDPGGVAVCSADSNQVNTALAPDGSGGALAVWFDHRQGNNDVYAQRLTPSGLAVPAVPRVVAAPNPTSGASIILFDLSTAGRVHAELYDVAGHRVRVVADMEELVAGRHSLTWDGLGDDGRPARAGIYFLRIRAGTQSLGAKLVRVH